MYNGSTIFPNLTSRQLASLNAALRLAPGDYREGLLRNIYSLLGVADSYTGASSEVISRRLN